MKENNNQIKIKLTTIIVLILLVVIISAGVLFVIFNKIESNQIPKENTTQSEYQPTNIKKNQNTKYADTELSFKFLKMENKKENIIYSPLSIKYALQMLNEGANGNTKTQIEKVIGETSLRKYSNMNNVLSLANAIYIRDTYSKFVKDEYKNTLSNNYNAEIKYDIFRNADNINNWIENKTFGQIKNMLQDAIVTNPENEMLLINALAIDMAWKEKFDGKDTYGGKFYLENGTELTATMMNKESKSDNISYYMDNKVTAISMDLEEYDNQQMEFIAIMPNDNLANYVKSFEADTLKNLSNNMTLASKTKYGLDISIPRFSFDYDLSLKDDLKKLGITDAFIPDLADFSNMSRSPLWVSSALHKANIDFTEKGVKAAAVTVIVMTDGMMLADEKKPIEIKIDKPFMYLIRDKKTGEIWFVGTVYEPNSWENDKSDYQYR